MSIRFERPADASQVRQINELAFGQPLEADLVDTLRWNCAESLSLVAESEARTTAWWVISSSRRSSSRVPGGEWPAWDWHRWRCGPTASGRASARSS